MKTELEQAAEKCFKYIDHRNTFISGAKWQAEQLFKDDAIKTLETSVALLLKKIERMYSEEEIEIIAKDAYAMGRKGLLIGVFNKWFEQLKKIKL